MSPQIWTNRQRMHPDCRIAVSVPAYAEEESVLECVWSVAQQQGLDVRSYEMAVIMNNSWEEAQQRTPAYRNNQRSLRLLKACISIKPLTVPARFQSLVQRIRSSGLSLVVVDASSPALAARRHSVGRARDTLARVLVQRFRHIHQTRGIILSTDADCRLDQFALSQARTAFDQHSKVVGAVGIPYGFYPADIPQADSIQVYFEVRKYWQLLLSDLGIIQVIPVPKLFSQFKLEGFCACFRIDAYMKAGGFAHLLGGEDYVLGFKLAQLGPVMTIPSVVHVPLRISHRTSMGEGLGWEVERALQAVTSQQLVFPSVEYYQAYGNLIRSLAKGRSWKQFSGSHQPTAHCLNSNIYSSLQTQWRSKRDFLKTPEHYFKLKQYLLYSVIPLVKQQFPDQPLNQVLQSIEGLVFSTWPQPVWRKQYTHALVQPRTDWQGMKALPQLVDAYNKLRDLHQIVERIQG